MDRSKIFLVDDDEISNYLNQSIIKRMSPGIEVREFRNGLEALNFFKSQRYDGGDKSLVLLDIRMPVMNGFEFLEQVNAAGSPLKESLSVIMLTSSDNPRDLEKARTFAVEGYLNKPLNEEALRPFLNIDD